MDQIKMPLQQLQQEISVNHLLGNRISNSMGFLNDVSERFPEAISLVAGRPDDLYFDLENTMPAYAEYIRSFTEDHKRNINSLGQYANCKGLINDILVKYLQEDEQIIVNKEDIMITVGAQEAFVVIITTLCNRETDVILIEEPGYMGISAYAQLSGYTIDGIDVGADGPDLEMLENRIREYQSAGKIVKVLYVNPDYQNPTGYCMPLSRRYQLLELAKQYNFLIIEDAVYNNFSYDGDKPPSLKSLPGNEQVIYVGSFAKILYPGLRIGITIADQVLKRKNGTQFRLMDEMEKVKSYISNNTPVLSQAVLGGTLIRNGYSLRDLNSKKICAYSSKRDTMLAALDAHIGVHKNEWSRDISWNRPAGGFFIRISVPFDVTDEEVLACASRHGVIFCPMYHFYLDDNAGKKELRLAFSSQTHDNIRKGIEHLAAFFRGKC
jgi:(S)-3,5-dihydroxyphenylglycine transaminase